jgi:hypothetical protein
MESGIACYLELGSDPVSSGNKNRIAKTGGVKIEEATITAKFCVGSWSYGRLR